MNDTAIVTCFYTNLHGTEYGGRRGREYHYLMSLASLLKISNADFIIYCDPDQQKILETFVEEHKHSKVTIIPHSLSDFYMKDMFSQYKNVEEAKTSDRCQEIQYLKTYWMEQIKDYDWLFWIDVGISYSGLIPNHHLIHPPGKVECFNSDLFCNELVNGMKKAAENNLLIFSINNNIPTFYRHCVLSFYDLNQDQIEYHTIAGIFGGQKKSVYKFHRMFYNMSKMVTEKEQQVFDEECIYNILVFQYPEYFTNLKFETWWHEDNAGSHKPNDTEWLEYIKSIKSFYNVLEDLIKT